MTSAARSGSRKSAGVTAARWDGAGGGWGPSRGFAGSVTREGRWLGEGGQRARVARCLHGWGTQTPTRRDAATLQAARAGPRSRGSVTGAKMVGGRMIASVARLAFAHSIFVQTNPGWIPLAATRRDDAKAVIPEWLAAYNHTFWIRVFAFASGSRYGQEIGRDSDVRSQFS